MGEEAGNKKQSFESRIPHTIYVWYIYLYTWWMQENMQYMDAMGANSKFTNQILKDRKSQ